MNEPNWPPAPDGRGGFGIFDEAAEKLKQKILGKQAPGAIPTGARVRKVRSDPNDRTPNGTPGTVLGSVAGDLIVCGLLVRFGYFIDWDNCKGQPVFTIDRKVEEITNGNRTR